MKYLFFGVMFILNISITSAQTIFQKTIGGAYNLQGFDLLHYDNGDIFAVGIADSKVILPINVNSLLMKTDSNGVLIWAKEYGGMYADVFRSIIKSDDGNLILGGGNYNTIPIGIGLLNDTLRSNAAITKIDTTGNVLWAYTYGDTLEDWVNDVIEKPNGDIVFTGSTGYYKDPIASNNGDILLGCLSADGSLKWCRKITSDSGLIDMGRHIILTAEGGYYVSGYSYEYTNATFSDCILLKLDSVGNIIWKLRMGEPQTHSEPGMVADNNNGVLIGFSTYRFLPYTDLIIANIDSSGNVVWSKKYGNVSGGYDNMTAFTKLKDSSGYIFASYIIGVKIDNIGTQVWSRVVNAFSTANSIKSIGHTNANGYTFLGNNYPDKINLIQLDSTGYNCGGAFFAFPDIDLPITVLSYPFTSTLINLTVDSLISSNYLTVLDTTLCYTATSINFTNSESDFEVYPNPVSDVLFLKIPNNFIDEPSINFSIYDLYGKLVFETSITSHAKIDISSLNNGLFIATISNAKVLYKKKIIKLKTP